METPSHQPGLALADQLTSDPAWARSVWETFLAYLHARDAIPGGQAERVTLQPNTITPRQERLLARGVEDVHGALQALVDRVLEDEALQDAWGLTDAELALHRVDPGYPTAVQVARFDGFLEGGDLKFLEFNCDSPGGAGRADVLHEAFADVLERSPQFAPGVETARRERVLALREALLAAYRAWRDGRTQRRDDPFIVVTDWADVRTRADIDITVRRLRQSGLDVAFADPRELVLDGDELTLEGRRVDLVYKRVILKELLAEPAASDLLEAYEAGTVCMVNPPRSVLAGNKKALAWLTRRDVLAQLTPAQRVAVREHVPFTRVLEDRRVVFDEARVHLRDLALEQRDRFVLKAAEGYGGEDVHLGFQTAPEAWGALVDTHLDDGDWVIQELVSIPTRPFARIGADRVDIEQLYVNVNPFVFGGRYAGSYTRVSRSPKINVSQGGAIAATVTLETPGDPVTNPAGNRNLPTRPQAFEPPSRPDAFRSEGGHGNEAA